MDSLFKKVGEGLENIGQEVGKQVEQAFGGGSKEDSHSESQPHQDTHQPSQQGSHQGAQQGAQHKTGNQPQTNHRFASFAPQTSGNNAKWYVDGASYFWAVSEALEKAQESILILDWWLSPELYLRRPPSKNERYRLDRMLRDAAERGVKVNVIVYKEVEAALTLDSAHTRQALEALNPNIKVFRHPDHYIAGYDLKDNIGKSLKTWANLADDVVLYWAHHEKLCVIDHKLAFMGGLDMCFGRWDTSSHPIADVHPADLKNVVWPGQDYNNARVYDFDEVQKWQDNKLDRTKSSRMGWSDVALSLKGNIVHYLVEHFADRWNFIYGEKYEKKNPGKYAPLKIPSDLPSGEQGGHQGQRGEGEEHRGERHHRYEDYVGGLSEQFNRGLGGLGSFIPHGHGGEHRSHGEHGEQHAEDIRIQLTRSCSDWSSGHDLEHSIQNAYIDAIRNAEHFVYIENQFFITATDPKQRVVKNQIGLAIVERITKAWQEGQDFKVWVLMPAVPAFAGDLKSEGALGTRAIMEFQYASISRGKNSIIEKLKSAGVEDPSNYIRFYNLRNFDRINTSKTLADAESRAGVSYEEAREEHDEYVGSGRYPQGQDYHGQTDHYDRYQREAHNVQDTTLDTISSAYMNGGPDVATLRWDGNPEDEIDAYVSELLYIHTKLLIADDRLVICGSANLNDRSQLGNHDSEIAVVIEDQTTVDSRLNGRPYRAARFATSLRRYIFRKHMGLIPDQRWDRPDQNWQPVDASPNRYDWGSREDELVEDPLSPRFLQLWERTARTNTDVFSRAFHPVPNDRVRTWKDYDDFFSRHFIIPGKKDDEKKDEKEEEQGRVEYGHVVKEEFPGGVRELKEWLGRVRGTLVEMPLDFLVDVDDIAHGLALNDFTEEIYT